MDFDKPFFASSIDIKIAGRSAAIRNGFEAEVRCIDGEMGAGDDWEDFIIQQFDGTEYDIVHCWRQQ